MIPHDTPGIQQAIQFALAPAFLLVAVGSLLNVLTSRLARIIDRARRLEEDIPVADDETREWELRTLAILDRRMSIAHWAIAVSTVAAILVSLVIIILFAANLVTMDVVTPVSLLFIAAMISLALSLILFLIEVSISTHTVRVRDEFIRRRRWRSRVADRIDG